MEYDNDRRSIPELLRTWFAHLLIFVVVVIFYGIFAIHDIQARIAEKRHHPPRRRSSGQLTSCVFKPMRWQHKAGCRSPKACWHRAGGALTASYGPTWPTTTAMSAHLRADMRGWMTILRCPWSRLSAHHAVLGDLLGGLRAGLGGLRVGLGGAPSLRSESRPLKRLRSWRAAPRLTRLL